MAQRSTNANTSQSQKKIEDIDVLEFVGMQGVATSIQAQRWFGLEREDGIRKRMTRLCTCENPWLTNRNLPRPWINSHNYFAAFLTDLGAAVLNERNGTRIIAPSQATQQKNLVHGLGLVDIAVELRHMGLEFDLERRIDIDRAENEFIRPDILCRLPNGQRQLIEFEQTRSEQELRSRLLGRLRRWQQLFSGSEMPGISRDVIVLFAFTTSKKDPDRHTTSIWSEMLHRLMDELGAPLAFTVWSMPLGEFLGNPTLELIRYKQLLPSLHPDADALAAERERFFARQLESILPAGKVTLTKQATQDYFQEYRWRLATMQSESSLIKQFLDVCDHLYAMAFSGPEETRRNGSVPWLGIGVLRFWLEQPLLAKFRLDLIDTLESFRSSYGRGLYSAADALERLVWGVLLRQFGIGKNGPVSFYAQVGSSEKDKDRRSGLIPVFAISSPWSGVREDQDQADVTANALTWLVQMLLDYPTELGMTKENKKAQSSAYMDQGRKPKESDDSPPEPVNSD